MALITDIHYSRAVAFDIHEQNEPGQLMNINYFYLRALPAR
ncbi:hypothetical protein M2273_000937 [Mucilaginibacter lappiensis]